MNEAKLKGIEGSTTRILRLTPLQLQNILIEYFELQDSETVEFEVGSRSVGFGPNERDITYFSGVTITTR